MATESLTREERLFIWLRRKELSYAEIGRQLGVTRMSALRMCKAQCISSMRHEQLCALGIPASLLPVRYEIKRTHRAYKKKKAERVKTP
jgi:hypothetical protein